MKDTIMKDTILKENQFAKVTKVERHTFPNVSWTVERKNPRRLCFATSEKEAIEVFDRYTELGNGA